MTKSKSKPKRIGITDIPADIVKANQGLTGKLEKGSDLSYMDWAIKFNTEIRNMVISLDTFTRSSTNLSPIQWISLQRAKTHLIYLSKLTAASMMLTRLGSQKRIKNMNKLKNVSK